MFGTGARGHKSKLYGQRSNNESSSHRYLFSTGSVFDWVMAKDEIQARFQAAGCWDHVNCPEDQIPIAAIAGGPIPPYPELTMHMVEPVEAMIVAVQLATYDTSSLARYNAVAAAIQAANIPQGEERRENLRNEIQRREDIARRGLEEEMARRGKG